MMHNQFQPLFAKHDPDGLSARLNSFLGGDVEDADKSASTQHDKKDDDKAEDIVIDSKKASDDTVKDGKADDKVSSKADEKTDDKTDDAAAEDEFPDIRKAAAKTSADGFDEAEFDKETDKGAEGLDAKADAKFRKLRAELKSFKQREFKPDLDAIPEFKTLKSEVEDLRKVKEERDGLKARLDSVIKVRDELAVRESDEFAQKVSKPIKDMESIIKVIAESAGIDPIALADLIEENDMVKQDKGITSLEAKLPRRTISKIERLCDDYREVKSEEARLLSDIPKSLEEVRKQEAEKASQERLATTAKFQEAARSSFSSYAKLVPGFTDSTGSLSETGKAALSAAITEDIHLLTPEDIGYLVFASKALNPARKEIQRLRAEVERLGSSPDSKIAGKPVAPEKDKKDATPAPGTTLAERMKGMNFSFNPSAVG